jgi:hypothetical protein
MSVQQKQLSRLDTASSASSGSRVKYLSGLLPLLAKWVEAELSFAEKMLFLSIVFRISIVPSTVPFPCGSSTD